MKSLTQEELNHAMAERTLWHLRDGKMIRSFTFPGFVEALAFVNRVGALAEQHNHHPDIDIRYNRVSLGLITHDANGITQRDVRMAATIDAENPSS
jgi:4a-hydroxytetrahydrobiopterin dehydratase